jgi:hypothetical protein
MIKSCPAYLIDYGSVDVTRRFCVAILAQDVDDKCIDHPDISATGKAWTIACDKQCINVIKALWGLHRHYSLVVVESGEDIQGRDNTNMEADGVLSFREEADYLVVTITLETAELVRLSSAEIQINADLLFGR